MLLIGVRILFVDHVRIHEATKSNKIDETKKKNPIDKSISIHSNNVDSLLTGNTPLDSVIRRYSRNVEADSETDIVISQSSKANYESSRDSSVSAFKSGVQPISDNLKQDVSEHNGNLHLENNRLRKGTHNSKLPLSNQYSDSIREQQEDHNLSRHSSSIRKLPQLQYGAKADTLISDRYESLGVSNSSNCNQESTEISASISAYPAYYSRNINDQANTRIDRQETTSFGNGKYPHRWNRKDLSSETYFQDTENVTNVTNRQATSYDNADHDTFKDDQCDLDYQFAAALQLQLNENAQEYEVDPRRSNYLGSSVNPLDDMEIPDTSLSSTVHTSKVSQSESSIAKAQEQLDWECAMKLHEQLNARTPKLESGNMEEHNAMPMNEEFAMQFPVHEQLNAQTLEMKPEDIANGNSMQTDESCAMRLHEQLNTRRQEFDSEFINRDNALQLDEEYAMRLHEQINEQRPELTVGSNDVSNLKISSDSPSNTIRYDSTTTSDREYEDKFKTTMHCSSNDETRKLPERSIISTTRDRESLSYTSNLSKYDKYKSQTTSEEFPSFNSEESFDDDKESDIEYFQPHVESAVVAQKNDGKVYFPLYLDRKTYCISFLCK